MEGDSCWLAMDTLTFARLVAPDGFREEKVARLFPFVFNRIHNHSFIEADMNMMGETRLTHEGSAECEQLYRSEHARVVRLCRLLLMNQQDAEEVAQEVFLRLVRERAANRAIVSWEAWLTRVAVNACHDRKRSAWWKLWNRNHVSEGTEGEMMLPSQSGTPEEHVLSHERQRQVWNLFGTLSPRQREVFVLRRLEGLSTEEAATMLGLSSGSIKRHLFHAMRHLQKALGES